MEIHKPKPFHDWREFLSEVLIIILGVSIALAAEQAIEALHWHHKIEAIEDAMRAELVDDDLPQAYARLTIGRCLSDQLDRLQKLARVGADGARFSAAANAYQPPFRTWDSEAWKLAQQSDLGAHLSAARVQAWQLTYAGMVTMNLRANEEMAAVDRLKRTRYAMRKLTQSDADELNDTIDALRRLNLSITRGGFVTLGFAQQGPGLVVPAAAQNAIVAEARRNFGPCVIKPRSIGKRNDVQFDTRGEAQRDLGL
jgi:hypothetical protein